MLGGALCCSSCQQPCRGHIKAAALVRRGIRATISADEGQGFLKLIVAKDTDKVVGAHFVGAEVAEMMQV